MKYCVNGVLVYCVVVFYLFALFTCTDTVIRIVFLLYSTALQYHGTMIYHTRVQYL